LPVEGAPPDVLFDVPPDDVQHDALFDPPPDVPSDVQHDALFDPPPDVPSDVLPDVLFDVQHAVLINAPSNVLVDVPSHVPVDVPFGPPSMGEAANVGAATTGCPATRTARMATDTTMSPPMRRLSGFMIAPVQRIALIRSAHQPR